MWEEIFALVIGFIGGFAGGLLGIGGGAIYIPAMVLILDEQQHLAQGASLAAIISTAVVGGATHNTRVLHSPRAPVPDPSRSRTTAPNPVFAPPDGSRAEG